MKIKKTFRNLNYYPNPFKFLNSHKTPFGKGKALLSDGFFYIILQIF